MPSTRLLTALSLLAALASGATLAASSPSSASGERQRAEDTRAADSPDQDMQAVPLQARDGDRHPGWQYFSDPAACRAVVISPQGDYYFSRGKGLRWVAAAQED